MQVLRHMHLQFLTPLPKLMAELMGLLEEYHILAPVDLFFPVYSISTACSDEQENDCQAVEDRSGIISQDSLQGSRHISVSAMGKDNDT